MKKIALSILALIVFASCKKEPINRNLSIKVSCKYCVVVFGPSFNSLNKSVYGELTESFSINKSYNSFVEVGFVSEPTIYKIEYFINNELVSSSNGVISFATPFRQKLIF